MAFRAVAAAFVLSVLAGCASNGGTQVGDTLEYVFELQAQYCAAANPNLRAAALAGLASAGVSVPARGACTDILALATERGLEELSGVDTEAAREDQRRAQERLDEVADESREESE